MTFQNPNFEINALLFEKCQKKIMIDNHRYNRGDYHNFYKLIPCDKFPKKIHYTGLQRCRLIDMIFWKGIDLDGNNSKINIYNDKELISDHYPIVQTLKLNL